MHHEDQDFSSNRTEQKHLRRELRNEGTPAEATLWFHLKERKIEGMRWRRQFSVGPYILDFYCPQLRLCIELDGAPHYTLEGSEHDNHRDEWLAIKATL
jgi:very-short-patch-repair endonuclease